MGMQSNVQMSWLRACLQSESLNREGHDRLASWDTENVPFKCADFSRVSEKTSLLSNRTIDMSLNLDDLKLVVVCGPHPREKSGGESGWLDPDVEYEEDDDEEHLDSEFGFITVQSHTSHFRFLCSS